MLPMEPPPKWWLHRHFPSIHSTCCDNIVKQSKGLKRGFLAIFAAIGTRFFPQRALHFWFFGASGKCQHDLKYCIAVSYERMVSTGYELSAQTSDLSLDCGQPTTNLLKPGSPCGIRLFPFLREPSDTD